MSGIVQSPTPEIQLVVKLLDEAIRRLIEALSGCGPIGYYESDVESFHLLRLIIRHVETVNAIASRDLVLLPSAMVVARAAYEAAIKLLWMIAPDDPFQREIRWLAHLQTEEEFYEKMADRLARVAQGETEQETEETIRRLQTTAQTFRQFRLDVEAELPEGCLPLRQLPNLYQMLESLAEVRKYLAYSIGCQFAHGTHHATGIYRKHLGTHKILGEHITPEDWWPCLLMSWYSLHASGERFLGRTGGNAADFLSEEFGSQVQAAIERIKRE